MFGISVSGIKNSQKHIDVTSNNIANTNSYGFKKSRAEFADVYANSIYSNSKTASGMGVVNTVVSQQFTQGTLSGDTGNPLDMAIQGNGFFVLKGNDSDSLSFTRNGAFQLDKEGYIVTATGDYLQGWDVNTDGTATSLDLNGTKKLQLPSDTGAPQMSTNIGIGVNLPADKEAYKVPGDLAVDPWGKIDKANLTSDKIKYGIVRDQQGNLVQNPTNPIAANQIKQYFVNFDPKDSSTYHASTSQTIHDSLGGAHTLTYYMIKMGPDAEGSNNTVWNVIPFVDGQPVDVAQQGEENPVAITVPGGNSSVSGSNFFGFQLTFEPNGEFKSQVPKTIELVNPAADGQGGTALVNSLRQKLFGAPGLNNPGGGAAADAGILGATIFDKTFEADAQNKAPFYKGNGSLHTSIGQGVDPLQSVHISFNATQYGSSNFQVTGAPTNDGYATGILTGMSVDENGVIQCEYSNGRLLQIGKVAMADFANTQGLSKIGDTQWKQSISSGEAIAKEANTGSAGSIKGSNLELSNVDLTSELVELITAQRNYQANAQSLQTNNTVMDSILNIRQSLT